ncbi:hypothetical protein [Sediminitomix flava]|uniref:Uncharacterized protein n=1 Tax=Sediminitomix flava TaxID=379075 RepID=A0A315ZW33_SEDFL|nr:hypothetical protein [Sediminitomix flava]PWJ40883.1 hypothetical protein BC781_104143 [Sediminitomix flava]
MNELKEFKNAWNQVKASDNIKPLELDKSFLAKLKEIDRKIKNENIGLTIAFGTLAGLFTYIWSILPSSFWLAHVSLIGVAILLFVSMGIFWYRKFNLNKYDFSAETSVFIEELLKKLKFQLWVTNNYMYFYTGILYTFIMIYLSQILALGSLKLQLIGYGGATLWMVLVLYFGMKKKKKSNKNKIVPLIDQLKELQHKLNKN